MKNKKNIFSLIALIIGVLALFYYFRAMVNNAGMFIGGVLFALPMLFMLLVAILMNAIGYFLANKTLTMISAILYLISWVLSPIIGIFVVPSMILQFVAYATYMPLNDTSGVSIQTEEK